LTETRKLTNARKRKPPVAQSVPLGEPVVVSRAGESDAEPRVFVQPGDLNQTAAPTVNEQTEKPDNQFNDLNQRVKNLESIRTKNTTKSKNA
jgi:hypothetical protein